MLNNFFGVFSFRVDNQIRPNFFGEIQLPLINVNGDHFGIKHVLGILQRQIAQSAQAINRDPLPRFDVGNFNRLIGGDPGAGDAAGGKRVQAVGHLDRIVRHHDALFRHAAIHAETGIFNRAAQGFVTIDAIFAMATSLIEPGDAGTVPDF
ncbi:hypothetical protein D3C78_1213680 [compost metagenome]